MLLMVELTLDNHQSFIENYIELPLRDRQQLMPRGNSDSPINRAAQNINQPQINTYLEAQLSP